MDMKQAKKDYEVSSDPHVGLQKEVTVEEAKTYIDEGQDEVEQDGD